MKDIIKFIIYEICALLIVLLIIITGFIGVAGLVKLASMVFNFNFTWQIVFVIWFIWFIINAVIKLFFSKD